MIYFPMKTNITESNAKCAPSEPSPLSLISQPPGLTGEMQQALLKRPLQEKMARNRMSVPQPSTKWHTKPGITFSDLHTSPSVTDESLTILLSDRSDYPIPFHRLA